MKILYLIDELVSLTAGTERRLIETIRYEKSQAVDVHLVILRGRTWREEEIGTPTTVWGIDHVFTRSGLKRLLALRKWIGEQGFTIVHSYFPESNLLAPWLARVPVVTSRRDLNYHLTPFTRLLQTLSNMRTRMIIANSEAVRNAVLRTEGVAASKLKVIYNGINISTYSDRRQRESIRAQIGATPAIFVVGVVANLRAVKGLDIFVRAAKRVNETLPSTFFCVVGDGPLRSVLESEIQRQGLERKFWLAGRLENVVPFLSALDLAVLPSLTEGFSNALLEYMAAGLPIIATNVGGNEEALGGTGVLIPAGDADILASAMIELIRDPHRRETLRTAAKARAQIFSTGESDATLHAHYIGLSSNHPSRDRASAGS